ncbi:MAG TPA: Pls/PosA family non-ribosomal peptide synthetase [Pirellulales bacterium]|jgi:non-ribosomal peptide synthetase-like protein|nr:Pls/PosA family non-ribosomal peptide synthetase [Pirellulales bacterium]
MQRIALEDAALLLRRTEIPPADLPGTVAGIATALNWEPDPRSGPPHDAALARCELLHELFELQAARRPQQVAVVCGQQQMTYAELDQAANRLAALLSERGIVSGDRVGLLLPRSADVYVTILAILKIGAAYVPLDPDYPAERIGYILGDCGAKGVVTDSSLVDKTAGAAAVPLCLDQLRQQLAEQPADGSANSHSTATSTDVCYVIYTSGSTGKPKGVEIEHRSATNLVRAEAQLFGVRPDDRVYQGFSIAFDASVEEVWLALFAGATLVAATAEMVHAGPALPELLDAAGVTVLSCVPTLLAMMEDRCPQIRLLILGGEACPAALVERWSRPGRRLVNTYGPTEATVIATWGEMLPGQPVTIGRPVPNYKIYLLDEQLRPVAAGAVGELYIGGVGVARGYVGRPDLTAERFVANPFEQPGDCAPRLYRTGDLGRFTPAGDIEFMGRADTQIKLRGFRVELSEIESVLLEYPGVRAVAVAVREDTPGVQQLAAYLVRDDGAALDEAPLRAHVRGRLPVYMMPAFFETLDSLPTLPSGKVDRRALPAPRSQPAGGERECIAPRNDLEQRLWEVWSRLFHPLTVSVDADFFLDLGGHSLVAAQMVSELRRDAVFAGASMLDVYSYPTIERLARHFAGEDAEPLVHQLPIAPHDPREPRQPSAWEHFRCGLAQLVALYFVLGLFSIQWLSPYVAFTYLVDFEYTYTEALIGAVIGLIAAYPIMLVLAVAAKWILIGRYKPGRYPLWGWYYFRWWLVDAIHASVPITYLAGTPLINIYYRLLGAKIGRNVHLGSDDFGAFDLLTIGEGTSIGTDAHLSGCSVEDGWLRIGPVTIGENCFVGTRSVLRDGAVMEDGSRLEDLSLLGRGALIPAGQSWAGSPARLAGEAQDSHSAAAERNVPSRARRFAAGVAYALGIMLFPILVVAAIFPGMIVMNHLNYLDDYYYYLVFSPVVAVSFVVFLCLEIIAIKWLLLGRVQPGAYQVDGSFYWRKWFVDQLMELSLDVLGPLYATIYLTPFYRALGAKLGKRAEVSTASFISPDLLSIDEDGFIADSVSLGAARVDQGWIHIDRTHVGKRSFIGNSALLPPGSSVGDNCLIGCLSTTPVATAEPMPADSSWLGSPAIFLPHRHKAEGFSDETTFHPSRKLWCQRAAIEFLRVTLPSTCFIMITCVLMSVFLLIHEHLEFIELAALFPLLYVAAGMATVVMVVGLKWLLMGRYRASEYPLWSAFVWKTELVTAMHESLACLFMVMHLRGTPFLCWYFRLLGAKIGRRVYLDTTDMTEFDLVQIADDAALNGDCTVQTHLFEDRIMKTSHVDIGPRCTVGAMSLVLYDTRMQEGSLLDDLSLLMKGETLPAWTRWQGIPAR